MRPAGLLATSLALGAAAAGAAPRGGVNGFDAPHHMLLWPEHAAPALAPLGAEVGELALAAGAALQHRRVLLPLAPGARTATAARRLAAVFHGLAEAFALQPLEWAGRAQAAAAVLRSPAQQGQHQQQLHLAPCLADGATQLKAVQTVDFSGRAALVELGWFELRRGDGGAASADYEWVPARPASRHAHDFSLAWLDAVRAFGSAPAHGSLSDCMWSEDDIAAATPVRDVDSDAAAAFDNSAAYLVVEVVTDDDDGRDHEDEDQGEDDLDDGAQSDDAGFATPVALPYRTGLRKRRLSGLSMLSEDSGCSFEPPPLEELFKSGELPHVATQGHGRRSRQRGSPLQEGCFVNSKAARSDLDLDCHGPLLARAAAFAFEHWRR